MEDQNMVVFDEVTDVAGEVVTTGSGKGWKLFGGGLAIAGLAYGGYKLIKKFVNRKNGDGYTTVPPKCNDEQVCDDDVE